MAPQRGQGGFWELIHRDHLRRNLAPIILPSTTQGSDYQMVEVGANFCLTHVYRVTFVVEEDEVSDAVDVLLLGAVTQMATANSLSDRFEER